MNHQAQYDDEHAGRHESDPEHWVSIDVPITNDSGHSSGRVCQSGPCPVRGHPRFVLVGLLGCGRSPHRWEEGHVTDCPIIATRPS